MVKIFFDADILFSLSYTKNPKSGAKRILLQGRVEKYSFITSVKVIEETRENLSLSINPRYLKRLSKILEDFDFRIIEVIDEELLDLYKDIIHEKDVHVFAAAIQSKADYLLTYNKKHFLTPKFKKLYLKLQVMNPKEYIEKVILKSIW